MYSGICFGLALYSSSKQLIHASKVLEQQTDSRRFLNGGVDWINAFAGYGNEGRYPFLYPFWFLRDLIILNFVAWPLFWLIRRMPTFSTVLALLFLMFNPPIHIVGGRSLAMFMIGGIISSNNFQLETIKRIPYWILLPLWLTGGVSLQYLVISML